MRRSQTNKQEAYNIYCIIPTLLCVLHGTDKQYSPTNNKQMTLYRTYSNQYFRGEFCRWNFWYILSNLVYSLLKERVHLVDILRTKFLKLRFRHWIKPLLTHDTKPKIHKLVKFFDLVSWIIYGQRTELTIQTPLYIFRIWLHKSRSFSSKR